MKFIFFYLLCFYSFNCFYSQCTQPTNLQLQSNIPVQFPVLQHNLTARRDTAVSKPYLYIAGKETGLVIYNITNIASPVLTASILPSAMQNLDVMSLTQAGNYLYLALGDHFNVNAQKSGMAIVDITNPALPVLKSSYSYSLNSGAGHVAVEGNYAYLSAMQNGIIVLDVTIKTSIQLVSVFKPSVHFPKNNPDANELLKINVRQVTVKNNVLYVCYDAGGVRIVDCTNKSGLVQTGKYANPLLNNKARAYNNLILKDSLLYVAVDYCGMEILNIKDTANISLTGWWNPWHCETPANYWLNSPGHTNEIEYDANCNLIFLSTGKSDMHVVNVSNPALPDSCARFGNTTDSLATWGLGRYNNQIYLAYISTWPWYIPFPGNWSGVKIITYNNACSTAGINELRLNDNIKVYPNPGNGEFNIKVNSISESSTIVVYNSTGQLIIQQKMIDKFTKLDLSKYKDGLYHIKICDGEGFKVIKVVKE